MNSTIFKNNIAELETQINALMFKNSELEVNALKLQTSVVELKTSNQLLSKNPLLNESKDSNYIALKS